MDPAELGGKGMLAQTSSSKHARSSSSSSSWEPAISGESPPPSPQKKSRPWIGDDVLAAQLLSQYEALEGEALDLREQLLLLNVSCPPGLLSAASPAPEVAELRSELDAARKLPCMQCKAGHKAHTAEVMELQGKLQAHVALIMNLQAELEATKNLQRIDYEEMLRKVTEAETSAKKKAQEQEERRKSEEDARREAEEESRSKDEEIRDARNWMERAESQRKELDKSRSLAQAEAQKKGEEADAYKRQAEEAERRRKAEEDGRNKAEESFILAHAEALKKGEEAAKYKKKAEEAEMRRKAEEEGRKKAEEQARKMESQAKSRVADEEALTKASMKACKKAEEEARLKEREVAEAKKNAAKQEAQKQAEEKARKMAEEELNKKKEEVAKYKRIAEEEEKRRKMAEAAQRKAETVKANRASEGQLPTQCRECSSHLHKIAELREEGVELREEHLKKIAELRDEVLELRNEPEEAHATQYQHQPNPVCEDCKECSSHLQQIKELREEILKLRAELEETKAKQGPLIQGLQECASHVEKIAELQDEVVELHGEIDAVPVENAQSAGMPCQECATSRVKIEELRAELALRAPPWKSPRAGATPIVRRSFSGGVNTRAQSPGEKSGSPVARIANADAAGASKGRGRGRSVPQRMETPPGNATKGLTATGVRPAKSAAQSNTQQPPEESTTPMKQAQSTQNMAQNEGLPLVQCAVVAELNARSLTAVDEIPAPQTVPVSSAPRLVITRSARQLSPIDTGSSISTPQKRPASPPMPSKSGSLSPKIAPSCWPRQANPPCQHEVPAPKKIPSSPPPRSASPSCPASPSETGPHPSPQTSPASPAARSASPVSQNCINSTPAAPRSPPQPKSPPPGVFEAGLIAIKTPRQFAVSRSPPRRTGKAVPPTAASPRTSDVSPTVKEVPVEVVPAPPSPPVRGVVPPSGASAVLPPVVVPVEVAPGRPHRSLSPGMIPAQGVPARVPGNMGATPGCFWQPPANLFVGPFNHCSMPAPAAASCGGAALPQPVRATVDRRGVGVRPQAGGDIGQNLNSHLAAALQRAATVAAVGGGNMLHGHQSRGNSLTRQEQPLTC